MAKTLHSRHNEILLAMLRELREVQRLRQADLADRLGRVQATVSKVERGERRLDVIELRDWLDALGTDFIGFVSTLDAELRHHGVVDGRLVTRNRAEPMPSAPPSEDVLTPASD